MLYLVVKQGSIHLFKVFGHDELSFQGLFKLRQGVLIQLYEFVVLLYFLKHEQGKDRLSTIRLDFQMLFSGIVWVQKLRQ